MHMGFSRLLGSGGVEVAEVYRTACCHRLAKSSPQTAMASCRHAGGKLAAGKTSGLLR
jgi:hypothetical protein